MLIKGGNYMKILKKQVLFCLTLLFMVSLIGCAATTRIAIDQTDFELERGATKQLSATLENSNNTRVQWLSDDDSIATINSMGVISGISKGRVQITATTNEGVSDTIVVTVIETIKLIFDRKVETYEKDNLYRLFFAFKNDYDIRLTTNGTVDIYITNDNGIKVYEKTISLKPEMFSEWGNDTNGYFLKAAIEIPFKDIENGGISTGKLSYKVTLPDETYFGYYDIVLNNIPNDAFIYLLEYFKENGKVKYDELNNKGYNISLDFDDKTHNFFVLENRLIRLSVISDGVTTDLMFTFSSSNNKAFVTISGDGYLGYDDDALIMSNGKFIVVFDNYSFPTYTLKNTAQNLSEVMAEYIYGLYHEYLEILGLK